jgi:hypothetical protein
MQNLKCKMKNDGVANATYNKGHEACLPAGDSRILHFAFLILHLINRRKNRV